MHTIDHMVYQLSHVARLLFPHALGGCGATSVAVYFPMARPGLLQLPIAVYF